MLYHWGLDARGGDAVVERHSLLLWGKDLFPKPLSALSTSHNLPVLAMLIFL